MRYLLLAFLLIACNQSEPVPSPTNPIVGKWNMAKVFDDTIDVSLNPNFNPEGNRWAKFLEDGSFISDGDPYGRNTGKWTLNDSTKVLFLDSDTDEGDDSYWIVSIEGDSMTWRGTNSAFTERFTVTHKRAVE